MTISEILKRIPQEDHYESVVCVDALRIYNAAHHGHHGIMMILHRAYKGLAERCDLDSEKAGWVRLRQAMNRPTGVNEYE